MNETLGTLVVRIAADIKELEAGLNQGAATTRTATGNMQSSLDALQAKAISVAKGLAVLWVTDKAVEAVKEMALLNARYEELGVVMTVVGRNAGYNATQMERYALETQNMGISMIESRNTVIQLAQAQIDLSDASKLARIAQDAAVLGNMNSSEALKAMIYGIKTGQTEVLKTIGIQVNFEASYKRLADQLGVSTTALSEYQKMQARKNATMDEGAKLVGAYEAAMSTAAKQIKSMERYTEDLKVMQGQVFNEALTLGVMAFTEHLKDANGTVTEMAKSGQLKEWGSNITTVFATLVDAALNVVSILQTVGATTVWLANTAANTIKGGVFTPGGASILAQREDNAAYAAMLTDIWSGTGKMVNAMKARTAAVQAEADKQARIMADPSDRKFWNSVPTPAAAVAPIVKAAKDVKAAASEYDKLTEAINRQNDTVDEQIKYGDKLSESKKFDLKITTDLENAYAHGKITWDEWSKATDAARVVLEKMTEKEEAHLLAVNELDKAQRKADAFNKDYESANKAAETITEGFAAQVKGAQDALVAAQRDYEQLGLSKSLIAEMTLTRLQDQLVAAGASGTEHDSLVDRIALQKELIGVMQKTEVKAADIKAMDDLEKAGKQASDSINQSLTDALMQGGKNGAQYLQDLFRTLTLRPIISAIMAPISMVTAGMIGTMGTAAAGGVAGTAGTGMLGSLAGSAGYAAFSSGMSVLGTSALATSQSLIGLTGTAAQASTAVANGLAYGATGSGSMAASIGSYIPYVAVAVAAYMLLKGGGESQTGQGITGSFTGSGFTGNSYAEMTNKPGLLRGWLGANDNVYKNLSPLDAATQYQLSTAFDAMKKQTTAYADALGLNADKVAGYSKDITLAFGTDQAANQKLVADALAGIAADLANGVFGTSGTTTRTVTSSVIDQAGGWQGNGQDGTWIETTWKDITTTVTEGTSVVSQYAHGLETADQTLARLATSLTGVNAMFKDLGYTLLDKGLTGASKASNLVDSFGGLAQAQTAMNGYYQLFYTTAEQTANLTSNTADAFAGIGVVMPPVNAGLRDWYRGVVDNLGAQDMGVQANADAYAAAVLLYGAIDKLAPAAADTAAAIKALTDSLTTSNTAAHDQYNVLKGLTTQRDVDTRSMTEAQKVIYDDTAAVNASIAAFNAHAATLVTNAGLQDRLDVLMGTRTQTQVDRTNTLIGVTDVATIKLYNQVWAQEDMADAAKVAAQAVSDYSTQLAFNAQMAKDVLTIENKQHADVKAFIDKYSSSSADPLGAAQKVADAKALIDTTLNGLGLTIGHTAKDVANYLSSLSAQDLYNSGAGINLITALAALGPAFDTVAASIENVRTAYANVQSTLAAVGSAMQVLADDAKKAADDVVTVQGNISNALFAAQDKQIAAQQKVNDLTKSAADNLYKFSGTIGDFLDTISPTTGPNASLASLKAQLSETAVLAAGGDTGAQGKVISQAQAVMKALEASSTSALEYARGEAFVRNTLEPIKTAATKQADDLLATLHAAIDGVGDALAQAKADYLAASQDVIKFTALAIATGSHTTRLADQTAVTIAKLTDDYQLAVQARTNADNAYAAGLKATADLVLPAIATDLDKLQIALTAYDIANTALATAVGATGIQTTALGVQLGLTGTALANFVIAANLALSGFKTTPVVVPPPAPIVPLDMATAQAKALYSANPVAMQYNPNIMSAAATDPRLVWLVNAIKTTDLETATAMFNGTVTNYVAAGGLPQYASGTNYLQSDGPVYAHAGEEITPRPFVDLQRNARDETNALLARLLGKIDSLETEVVKLKKPLDTTAAATERHKDIAEQVAIGGLSNQTRAQGTPV